MKQWPWRADPFRWLVALFCSFLGALMFVTPHQFDGSSYAGLRPLLPGWGLLFLVAGAALVATAVFAVPRVVTLLAHALTTLVLIVLTAGVVAVGAWIGATGYVFLAVGILVAATVPRSRNQPPKATRDLLSLDIGASCFVSGIIIFALPSQLSSPVFDPVRSLLPLYGAGYLVGGAAVAANQLRPIRPRWLARTAHLVLGASMWAFVAPFVPLRVWTGIAYAGLFGAAIAVLPWLEPLVRRFDPFSLRVRLAVAMGAVAVLALIAIVALSTAQVERTAYGEALDRQQAQVDQLAASVNRLIDDNRSALVALADRPDLATLAPAAQHALLQRYASHWPDVAVFATYDANGEARARSDNQPPTRGAAAAVVDAVLRTDGPMTVATQSIVLSQPVLEIGAPYTDAQGHVAGVVVAVIPTNRLSTLLVQAGPSVNGRAYVVDGQGRLIADSLQPPAPLLADFTSRPGVQALLAGQGPASATQVFGAPGAEVVTSSTRLAERGWGIVLERSAASILAATRAGQDASLLALLIVCFGASLAGAWVADRLVAPLDELGRAVVALADSDAALPIPQTGVTEVARLAAAFADLRERLAAREAERDRLLEAERAARADADAAVKLRDDFLSIAAHELKTPLTGLQLLVQIELRRAERGGISVERLLEGYRRVDEQSHRLGRLIGQLLDVSRIRSGRLSLDRAPTDLAALVQQAVSAAQARSDRGPVVPGVVEPIRADVDALRLEQVLTNLIDNAVKYAGSSGPIDVELRCVAGAAVVSVRDRGPGIPPAERNSIFLPFFRGSTQDHSSGLGLGLAICREIVVLHGGQIEAEFPPDGGTRFVVRLPLVAPVTPEI
jgi:signal transduction histidine kinase